MTFSRRGLFATGTGALGALILAGCSSESPTDKSSDTSEQSATGTLTWWDQFLPTEAVEKEIFADFAKQPGGMPVKYTVYDPTKMGQAIQLARQSKQMPDILTLAGVGAQAYTLFQEGWFAPITMSASVEKELPDFAKLPGITVFEDKQYGIPAGGFRHSDSLNWFNVDAFTKAGLDPGDPPRTYDQFRTAAQKIQKVAGMTGWIAPLQFTARIAQQVDQMAQAAGSPSAGGIDFTNGEYIVDSHFYTDVIEWWLAMQRDNLLFESSSSLNARTARARWAAGAAGMFLDGDYCIGVVMQSFAKFASKVGVGPVVVPQGDAPVAINDSPRSPGNTLFISADSEHVGTASKLLNVFAGKSAQAKMASGMSFPPLYVDVMKNADVQPTFKKALEYYAESDFLAPDPVAKNPEIAKVLAEMKPVQPDLGTIVSGVMTGDVANPKKALTKLKDNLSKERERALKKVSGQGAKVSLDDWVFSNWKSRVDYGPSFYQN